MFANSLLTFLLLAKSGVPPEKPIAVANEIGGPATISIDCRQPIIVHEATKFIEEDSLCIDGSLATGNPDQLARQRQTYTSQSESTRGLAGLTTRTGMNDMEAESATALRIYLFKLKPKEEIILKLQSEHGRLMMRFLAPAIVDASVQDIRRANITPTPSRRSRIAINNSTGNSSQYALLIYGPSGHKYRLEIDRR